MHLRDLVRCISGSTRELAFAGQGNGNEAQNDNDDGFHCFSETCVESVDKIEIK